MSDVFISYASADRTKAETLAQVLEQQGWSVWWDRTIAPGQNWGKVIEQAIDAARAVIVLWSSDSVESEWVQTEAEEGRQRDILVPASIETVRPPLQFRAIQAADLSSWEGETDLDHPELQRLLQSVADLLEEVV